MHNGRRGPRVPAGVVRVLRRWLQVLCLLLVPASGLTSVPGVTAATVASTPQTGPARASRDIPRPGRDQPCG